MLHFELALAFLIKKDKPALEKIVETLWRLKIYVFACHAGHFVACEYVMV